MKAAVISKLIMSEHGEILQALDIEFCKKLRVFDIDADVLSYDKACVDGYDLLIISGGNDIPSIIPSDLNQLRDEFELHCIKQALEQKIAIFGICKGAQSLAYYLGAKFCKTGSHVGEHDIEFLGEKMLVNSYHNYAIKSIKNAKVLATSNDGFIEAFCSDEMKILGAMWHFEREKNTSKASKRIFEILKDMM